MWSHADRRAGVIAEVQAHHPPLKVLLCGAGRRGLEHIDLLDGVPGLQLAGVHDISDANLERASTATSVLRSKDLDGILADVDPEIVVVATPPSVRNSLVERLTQHDGVRAIIVEKPFALSLNEADRMLAKCRERGIVLAVFHQLPYCSEFVRLRQAINDGELGVLQSLDAYCYGNLFDQGSHMVDILRWLAVEHEPQWVTAQGWRKLPALARFAEIPPTFVRSSAHPGSPWTHAVIGFSGGLQATLSSGLLTPMTVPRLGPWLQKRVVATGSEGVAEAHAAAHFRMLTSRTSGWITESTDLDGYRRAQQRFYAALRDTLSGVASRFEMAAEQRTSLEILVACQESERQARPVTLPLLSEQAPSAAPRHDPPAGSFSASQTGLRVSIVLPMRDHRGIGLQSVASWTGEQRCDPNAFELILVIDARTANMEDALTRLLRPHDQLIRHDGNDMAQYHAGACAARGDILFFSEPHCFAEPQAVAQIVEYMDTHAVDGLCARSTPFCVNAMGRAEARIFANGFIEWSRPESWVRVIVRGFALRRKTYVAVGGLEHRYSRFAEWLLSARLRSRGYQLDYAPGVGVHHRDGGSFSFYDDEIRQFTEGECLFRLESDSSEFVRTYFGSPQEWAAARAAHGRPVGAIVRSLRQLRRDSSPIHTERRTYAADLMRTLADGLFAGQRLLLKHAALVWAAQLRYWFSLTDEQRFRAFEAFYVADTSLARVRFALRQSHADPTGGPSCLT
jgi:predicted dehydrogenase